jgi:tetratricopeptide (TPR) repeat protein
VPDLRVSARTSSFYFKGKSEDVAAIAQKLRVAQILEGSVRKAGNTIRVTAQLIRADNGYHLWSKTYDRDVKDIFKIQDEIASAVVDALKAQLLPAQQIASRHRTDNTEAYTEYLLGNRFRGRDTVEDNRQALAAYQKAVALDPGYAAAYSGLADAEWRIADMLTGEAAGYQRASAAADKAIALAADSPEGYWARARLRNNYFFDWHGAGADYQEALAGQPKQPLFFFQCRFGRVFAPLFRPVLRTLTLENQMSCQRFAFSLAESFFGETGSSVPKFVPTSTTFTFTPAYVRPSLR